MQDEGKLKPTDNPKPNEKPAAPGLGRPLFTSYIYPYATPTAAMAGGEGGSIAALGAASATPSFIVFTYPYVPPDER